MEQKIWRQRERKVARTLGIFFRVSHTYIGLQFELQLLYTFLNFSVIDAKYFPEFFGNKL